MNAAAKGSKQAMASTASGGQFLATIIDEVTRETVRTVAVELGWQNLNIRDGGSQAALNFIENTAAPAFLLVDISDTDDPVAAMEAIAEVCDGDTRVVAIGLVNDVGLYRRLIEIGVSDYLVKPVSGQALSDAIRNAQRGDAREAPRGKSARSIAVIGARGGVGTTTIAVSVAWSMAQEQQLQVVLLDLDLHFGSLALSLDLEPGRGLREILTNPDRIDSLLIGSAMSQVSERLRVLGGEESLEDALATGADGLGALLSDLAGGADCIVVDTPRALGALSRHMLGVADVIAIVTDQSLPAMRDTQRLLSLIKTMRGEGKVVVVANRVGGVAGEIGRADFERGIGGKITFSVPADIKAANAAAERAKAFVEVARNGKTATALRNLAQGLAGTAPEPRGSLANRILGK